MKKKFGITIGGLHQKILTLVLALLIATGISDVVISVIKTKYLSDVVQSARVKQQDAIEKTSSETLRQSLKRSMQKSNALEARVADEMFVSLKSDVITLQKLAESLFENPDSVVPREVFLPDPANDGTPTAQVLCEAGVDYTKSDYLPIAAHMADTMEAVYDSVSYSTNVYIGFEDGTLLAVDRLSSNKYDENGKLMSFPVRERPWYLAAKEAGELCFSGAILDTYSGTICVVCSAPVYANGKLVGVVGIDLFLSDMAEDVKQASSDMIYLCIVSDEGKVIFAPEDNPVFQASVSDDAQDLRQSENRELADLVNESLSGNAEMRLVRVGDKDYYMAGSATDTLGWAVISVMDKDTADLPTKRLLDEYSAINDEASSDYRNSMKTLNVVMLSLTAMMLLLGVGAALLVAGRIVRPIGTMTESIIDATKNGKLFEMKPLYQTGDEIEVLANAFDELSKTTKQYISNMKAITKEKERIHTELSLATRIQASMLPHIFPPYPDRHEFEIFASMEPAKEVGGDFYDFFLIDSDHLGLVMADVSGKGIPAALFMMISKTILQSCAMLGQSAADILTKTNDALCSNNQVEMFVTVWLGILEISTGRMTCANAGHEYPVLKRRDGSFELFKDKHGIAIGCMEGFRYKEYELKLEAGDKLFVYTDGVPEATNADEKMFGNDRMIETLNQAPDASPEELLHNVRAAVSGFVGDAEQFDDLTMMCVAYHNENAAKPQDEPVSE